MQFCYRLEKTSLEYKTWDKIVWNKCDGHAEQNSLKFKVSELSTQTSALALETQTFQEAICFILQLPEEEKQGGKCWSLPTGN